MDDMIRGMVSQKGDKWDNSFSQDITNAKKSQIHQ